MLLGAGIYQVYYEIVREARAETLRGLSFFFGLLFVTEVMLILVFGVDYRYVEARYIGPSWRLGVMDFPLRMLVPCLARARDVRRAAALPVAHVHRARDHRRWRRTSLRCG